MSAADVAERVLRSDLAAGVLTLTLDRPDKRNALDAATLDALKGELARAAKDEAVRAVVLTGAGKAFCAGGDVEWMLARQGDPMATKRAQEERFGAVAKAILALEKPVLAKVNGDAIGAGLMLALAADVAVASEEARFGAPFANLALVPDTGGTWLLPKTLGLRAARELVLLPDLVDAKRAETLGLVNRVVAAKDLDAECDRIAARWAQGPTRALGLAKKALVNATSATHEQALADEAALQALCFTLEDHREGVAAFREKRAPRFTGR